MNAFMQFLLFVPGFSESFAFAPKSFSPIQEFIDQYIHDISENKTFASMNGEDVFLFFKIRFPNASIVELFESLIHILKPRWELFRSYPRSFRSDDLFLALSLFPKQLFIDNQYFDLTAFIEKRPDGLKVNYITYVKVDGCWYQCDEGRITQLRSNEIGLSLQRGVIAHYKKVT